MPPAVSVYYLYVVHWGAGETAFALCPPCLGMMAFDHMARVDRVESYALIMVANAVIWALCGLMVWGTARAIRVAIRAARRQRS